MKISVLLSTGKGNKKECWNFVQYDAELNSTFFSISKYEI